ncbi:MAG: ATP-binding protein [Candidatus Aminicenantes bacterium]|nr:ATP-binding protein [Candidatus Aminicenantes bacterium]
MEFIDREKELAALAKAWQGLDARLMVIYGKRRVGKTELIKQFIKGKPHIYFLGQRVNGIDNRRWLADRTAEHFQDDFLKNTGFPDWRAFFQYGRDHIKTRTILAIDEFPYLTESETGLPSIFQAGWDEYLSHTPVFLILCGSSIAMMESEVLAEKSPLFGRRTGQIQLKPFRFAEARKFYPRASFDRCLELYALAGGNPSYLKQLDPGRSALANIISLVLPPEAFLAREVEFLLREELREPRNYFAILKSIAFGKSKIGEIVNDTGLEKGILHRYLFTLDDLQVIHKEVPVTERLPLKSRKGLYRIQDQFIKFWFRHILPNRTAIEEGRFDRLLPQLEADFPALVAENYEKLAVDIVQAHEDLFFPMDAAGRWWNREEEIDLVAINEERKEILFGEAKWSARPIGTDILTDLKRKAPLVDWHNGERTERFCLFSRSGFTKDMRELAHQEGIVLFHKDKLIEV